ncbi:MAG: (d)CMP kinase [Gemmatimonadales bacterium]|nr:(d)CMP kinase [Gemmatimonadales bacterium]NIN11690.1 (d)CMP kinase [Gemmatimonadales bacterium]NIN50296.1 (d)CMP kinase [Gemmatimonadales bacterium]NIP07760.1 (d)CMP kinase [Gemmatimonadales bacterium]NIQ99163.1 (d)CMP kinase [Gemmatimonadales bacterium]
MTVRVVTIDGPAGSGKSTTAKAVAKRMNVPHVESGALYRALTLAALDAGVEFRGQRLVALARSLPVRLDLTPRGFRPEVAGVDVSREIREERVNARVSELSAIPEVRDWVNEVVREAVEGYPRGAVLDGRDMGTVVFPDAALKVFLTARPEERARRRLLQDGHETSDAEIARATEDLARRDEADSTRAVAPLVAAKDAVVLDTSDMTFEEQVAHIAALARNVFQ